jgi:hypothetical protein
LVFLAVTGASVLSWGSPADYLKQFLAGALSLALGIFVIRQIIRFNILGLLLIVACTALLSSATEFLAQPDAFYRNNGYLLLVAIAVLLVWPLLTWRLASNAVHE